MIQGAFWTTTVVVLMTLTLTSPTVIVPPVSSGTIRSTSGLGPGQGLPGHLPNDHIQHVITVMMENHDYDSYFATYCQVLGPYCSMTANGIPAGTCVPYYPTYPSYGCVTPFNFTPAQLTISDMAHDWYSGAIALDGGAMDGFYQAQGTTYSFGHYNQSTMGLYWDMAEQYGMGDNFFGGNLSWSLPNHWYLVAGATPPIAYNTSVSWGGLNPPYLDQANNTTTVQDLLNRTNVSWKYYDSYLEPYNIAILGSGIWGTAYDLWNPMAGRAESYSKTYVHHFVPRSTFLTDLQQGTLPNISWIMPDVSYSDHPGWNNSVGEEWFAQLVNSVESSPYWNSTAIFVTWDDYGGFYEHVAPPTILGDGLSFRAPFLVISPYSKENYVSHTQLDFVSLLRFVEWQFGLGCLRPLDCFSPLPLDFFDFNQSPRAPILFPTTWANASYPMPLQQLAPLNLQCQSCRAYDWPMWTGLKYAVAGQPDLPVD